MEFARQKRVNRFGVLVLVAGLLILALPAGATDAGTAVGVGTAVAVQKALASAMVSAGSVHQEVAIPRKVECRSPYKPPEGVPNGPPPWANGNAYGLQNNSQGPPPWANGNAYGLQADPPWKKWATAWSPASRKAAKK